MRPIDPTTKESVVIPTRVTNDMKRKLSLKARRNKTTVSTLVRNVLEAFLAGRLKEETCAGKN